MNLIESLNLAVANKENMKAAIISNFLEADDFFSRAQFVPFSGSFSYGWTEEKTLPNAGTRSLNADYTVNNGETEARQEGLKIYGGVIDVDIMQREQLGDEIVMKKQESQIKAIRLKILNDFINGSSATSAESFDGLKTQVARTAGRQERGYGVDNTTAALKRTKLDELIDNVDVGDSTVLIMDKSVRSYMRQYADSLLTFDKNDFGVPVARYGDIPILAFDRNNLNQKILGFTEASSSSSIFCVNLDIDKIAMLQGQKGLSVQEAEKSGSKYKYQVDWLLSLAVQGQYNAGRLFGFTAGTMTA